MTRYRVMVDDNFNYQDPDERSEHGVYPTADEALAVCQRLVDRFLDEKYSPGMSAEVLYDYYTSFDPFIVVLDGVDDRAKFSGWSYARERCHLICDHTAPAASGPDLAPEGTR